MTKREIRILIFLGIAVAAMIVLSAALSQLEFTPERPLPWFSQQPTQTLDTWRLGGGEVFLAIFRGMLALSLALLPVLIVYLIISPKARKQVLRQLIAYLTLALMFYLIARRIQPRALDLTIEMQGEGASLQAGEMAPFPEFVAAPPPWLGIVISLLIALVIVGVLTGVALLIARRRPRETALQQLARSAQETLDALQGGADIKNAVIRCYLEMSRVVRERRGLQRQADVTPHEFQLELEKAGLPGEPVRQLTRLFEDVRYGDQPPGEREGRQALACLHAIVEAAKS